MLTDIEIKKLNNKKIFLTGLEFSEEFVNSVRFERYSQHSTLGHIAPLGAFSYTYSPISPCNIIGRYCAIGLDVRVMQDQNPVDWVSTSSAFYSTEKFGFWVDHSRQLDFEKPSTKPKPVAIMNDVWIGQQVILKGGITIGNGAVIGAGSVVTRDVLPYSIVGGAPARHIRYRFDEHTRLALEDTAWWECHLSSLGSFDFSDVGSFIKDFMRAKSQGTLEFLPEQRKTLMEHLSENIVA